MALCHITGTVQLPDGTNAVGRILVFKRNPETVVAQSGHGIIPDEVAVRVASDGSVDFKLYTGNYIGFLRNQRAGKERVFKFPVPEAATANFQDILQAVDPVEPLPSWLTEVFEARDDAEAAELAAQEAADRAEASASSFEFAPLRDAEFGNNNVNSMNPKLTKDSISYTMIERDLVKTDDVPIIRIASGFRTASYMCLPDDLKSIKAVKTCAYTDVFQTVVTETNRYFFNASGNLVQASAGSPRVGPYGAIVEPSSANMIENPSADTSLGWDARNATATTLSLNANGVFNGVSVASSGNLWGVVEARSYSAVQDETCAISVIYRVGTSNGLSIVLRRNSTSAETKALLVDGVFSVSESSVGIIEFISDREVVNGGGTRILCVRFFPNFSGNMRIGIGPYSAAIGEAVTALAVQLEKRYNPTSYININATRSADYLWPLAGYVGGSLGMALLEFYIGDDAPDPSSSERGLISITQSANIGIGLVLLNSAEYLNSVQVTRKSDGVDYRIIGNAVAGYNKAFISWDADTSEVLVSLNGSPVISLDLVDGWIPFAVNRIMVGDQNVQGSGDRRLCSSIKSVTLFNEES